jgi:hypothetical protein
MSKTVEVARPPKSRRPRISDVPGKPNLVRIRVTETVNMRNAGTSPVNDLSRKGWDKPTDPKMLEASPDGNSFWMYIDRQELARQVERNNTRAKRQEGFREHDIVKSTTKEDKKMKGSEMEEEIKRSPTSDEHNG